MSILEKIRGGTESGVMRAVLGIIIIVFIFWGIGTGNQPTNTVVATVNGERITDSRYHLAAAQARRPRDADPSEEQMRAFKQEVLNNLIRETVLLQEADDLGLQISDDEVAATILSSPAFQDEAGEFSNELYVRHLKGYGLTKGQFEENIRRHLTIARLHEVAGGAVRVGEAEIRERWNQEMTSLQLELVAVRAVALYDDFNPSELEVETFVAENRAEIRAWYDEHFASRFHKPKRARARMILLRSAEDPSQEVDLAARMDAIRAEIVGDVDFAMLARKYSEDVTAESGGLLGEVRFDQLDPTLASAIFGTESTPLTEPGLRRPVLTDRGLQLILVEEILPEETIEEEAARPEIARILMQERQAPALATAYAEQLRGAWAQATDGAAPLDLLFAQGLTVDPFEVTLADPRIDPWGELPALTEALRTAAAGAVLPEVFEAPEAWLVVRVASRTEPDAARFMQDLPMLRPRIEMRKRDEFVDAWVDDLVARARVKQLITF